VRANKGSLTLANGQKSKARKSGGAQTSAPNIARKDHLRGKRFFRVGWNTESPERVHLEGRHDSRCVFERDGLYQKKGDFYLRSEK